MKLNEYQKKALKTWLATREGDMMFKLMKDRIAYLSLGLCEAGEVQNIIKKWFRGDYKDIKNKKEEIKDELGDLLWYISVLANELNITLEDIAKYNIKKLKKRYKDRFKKVFKIML